MINNITFPIDGFDSLFKTTLPAIAENLDALNTAGFITKSVDDLVNYYLKSDTYTKSEVQQLIDAVKQFAYEVVQTLPQASADTMGKIYLVPSSDPQAQNIKDEYITIDNGQEAQTRYTWEKIGSTDIDLSGYVAVDKNQELTEVQKTTARHNIGASSSQDSQIIMSQIVQLRNKDNYITKNLGYIGSTMGGGENECASATNSGDDKIAWLIFEFGTAESPSVAMVHQDHGETTTKQTIFFGNKVSERTITFTNSQRIEVQSIGSWSTVTSLFGVQATGSNVVLRLLNHLLSNSAGLYQLTIPSVNSTTAGVMTPQQLGSMVSSSSVRTIVALTQAQYDALATKDTNTEYNIIERV